MSETVEKKKAVYDNLTNEEKVRALILEELLDTEKSFLKKMNFISQMMKPELERCSNAIEYEIDDGQVRGLFGNIDEIARLHQHFYEKLREALPEGREREPKNSIGHCFIELKTNFQIYDQYITNHARSQMMLSQISQMSSMKSVYEGFQNDSPSTKGELKGKSVLEVYLREPLLRVCKYNVILKELGTFTSFNHPDLDDISTAHQIIHSLMTSFDSVNRMDLLTAAFESSDKSRSFWEKAGLANKEGFLTKRGGNVKSWKIRWFTLRGYEIKYYDEPSNDKPLSTLDLKQCRAIVEDSSLGKPHCFGIQMPDRTYHMYCISLTEKVSWMNAIAWRLFNEVPAHMRAGQCMSTAALSVSELSPIITLVQKNSPLHVTNGNATG